MPEFRRGQLRCGLQNRTNAKTVDGLKSCKVVSNRKVVRNGAEGGVRARSQGGQRD